MLSRTFSALGQKLTERAVLRTIRKRPGLRLFEINDLTLQSHHSWGTKSVVTNLELQGKITVVRNRLTYDRKTDADCQTKCYRCCCCKCHVHSVIRKNRIAVTKVGCCCKETVDSMDMDSVEDMYVRTRTWIACLHRITHARGQENGARLHSL